VYIQTRDHQKKRTYTQGTFGQDRSKKENGTGEEESSMEGVKSRNKRRFSTLEKEKERRKEQRKKKGKKEKRKKGKKEKQ
jgi:hypothetical protein